MFGDASHCLNFDTFRDTAPLKSSQEISQPSRTINHFESHLFDKSFEIITS